jgi:uncharacterized protein YjlB
MHAAGDRLLVTTKARSWFGILSCVSTIVNSVNSHHFKHVVLSNYTGTATRVFLGVFFGCGLSVFQGNKLLLIVGFCHVAVQSCSINSREGAA